MNLKRIRSLIAAAMVVSSSLLAAENGKSITNPKPNFIVILADDLGYNDLGCYGSPLIKTPNLDQMAREGVRFTSFYVGAPVCTPSRAALLTGCYPARVGMGDDLVNQPGFGNVITKSFVKVIHSGSKLGLNPDETIIPEMLKPAGYFSGLIGKWHLGDAPEFNPVREGFDSYFGVPYSNDMKPFYFINQTERLKKPPVMDELTATYTDHATSFIRAHRDQPFFLYLAHNMPHTPLTPGKRFAGHSPRGLYGDAVEEIDWSVGEIVKSLKENKLDDRTLVIFLSDNGPWIVKGENGGSAFPLRNGKTSSYEGGFRVPCVMWGPGILKNPGLVSDEILTAMDFLPTFAALAGISHKPEKAIDGKDATALITGQPGAKSPWPHFYYYFGTELHGVRENQYKLRPQNILQNEDIYRRDEFAKVPMPAVLYDLSWDISEQKSILKDHEDIQKHLETLMNESRQTLGDTLTGAKGKENRPPGVSEHPVNPKE
ncbi:MAG: arylsulfatase [Verrucomicrobiales bacterium]|nr:arylsulfatase [Verrucomicrobiales bacterium]